MEANGLLTSCCNSGWWASSAVRILKLCFSLLSSFSPVTFHEFDPPKPSSIWFGTDSATLSEHFNNTFLWGKK